MKHIFSPKLFRLMSCVMNFVMNFEFKYIKEKRGYDKEME